MRIGSRLGQTALRPAAAAFMLLAASALSAALQLDWTRAEALDLSFSIETPCSLEEIEALRSAPLQLGGLKTSRDSRVLCTKGEMVFFAIVSEAVTPPGSPTLFDMVAERTAKTPDKPGASTGKLGDRRALINREAKDGDIAQTAVVDLGSQGVMILNVGVLDGSPLSDAEKAEVIDRFTNSLKVAAK